MLTSGDLNIDKDLTIHGPVARTLSVSSDDKSGDIVHVLRGLTVTISNLNFVDSITYSNSFIYNEGILTLVNSAVSGNTSNTISGGGGIDNDGTLTLTNSTVSDNTSNGDGGGIFNVGTLTVTNSTVSDNTSNSINSLSNGDGGGIDNFGTLTVTNSTVSDNTSKGGGGGIFNASMLTMTNSTVSDNTSKGGGGIDIAGGGIDIASQLPVSQSEAAQADLIFSTIYDNRAPVGADIAIKDVSSPTQISQVTISDCIVTGDTAHRSPDISGTLTSNGYNLFQDTSGATFDPSTAALHHTDKLLSANDLSQLFASPVRLQYTGGPTRTLALAPNSPAVDAIPLAYCQIDSIITDQRGVRRPDGNERVCDIGAYEYVD